MLRLNNISRSFPGVRALQDVTLEFQKGEVHALCGENGAGKSTLMSIIMGILQPNEGEIEWNGKPVSLKNVSVAHDLGFSIVFQERTLVESLSIAENIFPVKLPVTKLGNIDFYKLYKTTAHLLTKLGLANLSPQTTVGKLSTSQKQMIEIAKAIAKNPGLLILDEPTASLTHLETAVLFQILRNLKADGVAIIYISHRMAEIEIIADRISVLRDGRLIATVDGKTQPKELIRLMVGRDLEQVQRVNSIQQSVSLEAKNISGRGFSHINFQLHKGEILGLAGLQGSGRSSLAKALIGDQKIVAGTLYKKGTELHISHPSDAIKNGIVYLPEDRKHEGLFLEKTIYENLFSSSIRTRLYDRKALISRAEKLLPKYRIRAVSSKIILRKLSGGNQQKTMLAKWINLNPEIIIVNEPTHGVDVGSKAEIYELLRTMTAAGSSIVLISSELPELLLLCDRIAVMHEGRIETILQKEDASEEKITALASGVAVQ